jgi:hypothetical protein
MVHLLVLRHRVSAALPTKERCSPRPALTVALALCGAVLATACGSSSNNATLDAAPAPVPLATPSTVQIAPELLTPLFMLGPCSEVTDPGLPDVIEGLELPEGAFLTEVTDQGELVRVQGYVPLTPILFQLTFREREDLEMITVENEIHESETLYSDGERRVFLKAAAVCELGSVFLAAIAADANADAVPSPSGAPSDASS